MTLPFAPRCPEGECPALKNEGAAANREMAIKPSAFDALAALQSNPESKVKQRNKS